MCFPSVWAGKPLPWLRQPAHRPSWKTDVATTIRAVNRRKEPHWNAITMIGDRVNNTPGVRATAATSWRRAVLKTTDGTEISDPLAPP